MATTDRTATCLCGTTFHYTKGKGMRSRLYCGPECAASARRVCAAAARRERYASLRKSGATVAQAKAGMTSKAGLADVQLELLIAALTGER